MKRKTEVENDDDLELNLPSKRANSVPISNDDKNKIWDILQDYKFEEYLKESGISNNEVCYISFSYV
jgi:hypothetical protein